MGSKTLRESGFGVLSLKTLRTAALSDFPRKCAPCSEKHTVAKRLSHCWSDLKSTHISEWTLKR